MEAIQVSPESSADLRSRVFRLRYKIYCEEMDIGLNAEDGEVRDTFDAHSTSFLATASGKDIGTIRCTCYRNGPFESEQQSDSWRDAINVLSDQHHGRIGEVTRLMIIPEARQSAALPSLFIATIAHSAANDIAKLVFAGRDGRLANVYTRLGAERIDVPTTDYRIGSANLGEAWLMALRVRGRVPELRGAMEKMANDRQAE